MTTALNPIPTGLSAELNVQEVRESPLHRTVIAASLSMANLLFRIGSQLALIPLCQRFLGSSEYGLWIVVQSIGLYISLCEAGFGQTITNFVGAAFARHDETRLRQIQSTSLFAYCGLSTVTTLVAVSVLVICPPHSWLLPTTPEDHRLDLQWSLIITAVLTSWRFPFLTYKGLMLGTRCHHQQMMIDTVGTVISFLATFAALLSGAKIIILTVVVNLSLMVPGILSLVFLFRECPNFTLFPLCFDRRLLAQLTSNASFFVILGLATLLDRSTPSLLIASLGSLAIVPLMFTAISIYRVAGWSMIQSLCSTVQPYVIVWAVSEEWHTLQQYARLATNVANVIAAAFVAAVGILSPLICRLLLGSTVHPDLYLFDLLGAAFILEATFLPATYFAMALNRHRILAVTAVAKAFASLCCSAIAYHLMPDQPERAIAIGILIVSAAQCWCLPFVLAPALHLKASTSFRLLFCKPLINSLGLVGVVMGMHRFDLTYWDQLWVGIALVATVAAAGWRFVLDATQRALLTTAISRIGRFASI